jgi:hypothetical protein
MVLNTSGYVGIGTTNPTSPLTIKAGSRGDTLRLSISGSSSVSDAVGITFGSATYDKASIVAYNENTGNAAGYLTFFTGGSPATTDNTERMRITSLGYLKVSPNADYMSTSGPYSEFRNNTSNTPALYVSQTNTSFNDNCLFVESYRNTSNESYNLIAAYNRTAGEYKCYIRDSGDIKNKNGSYGTIASDRRLKENIVNATSKIEDIMKLRVVNFNLIGNEQKNIGFIAQEMKDVFPSLVSQNDTREYDENGNVTKGLEDALGLKVGMEFAILVKAIQELKTQNDALQSRIETLESK